MLVDSHCHIEAPDFDPDRYEALERAQQEGVTRILCVGSGDWRRQSMQRALDLADRFDWVDASIGMHPHDAACYDEDAEDQIVASAIHLGVVGWGEIGLDYHYMHAERQTQISVFRRQMDLAQRHRLPVIIHMRDAEQDTLQVLRQSPRLPLAGVMHCFGGDWQTACQCMDLDFFISFAGNVTFKKAVELQEVARKIPADRLLVETDSPYLSPEPVRGRRNEPAHVRYVVQFLAQLRGEPCQSLEETTSRNYLRLFRRRNE